MELVLSGVSILENNVEFKVLNKINEVKERLSNVKYVDLVIAVCLNEAIPYKSSIFASHDSFKNKDMGNKYFAYCFKDVGDIHDREKGINNEILFTIVKALDIQIKQIISILDANNLIVVKVDRDVDRRSETNYIKLILEDWETAKFKKLFFHETLDIYISNHNFSKALSEYLISKKILFRDDALYELIIQYSHHEIDNLQAFEEKLRENAVAVRAAIDKHSINIQEIYVFAQETSEKSNIRVVITQKENEKPKEIFIMADSRIRERLLDTYCYEIASDNIENYRKNMDDSFLSPDRITYKYMIASRDRHKIDDFADQELKDKYKWAVQLVDINGKKYLFDKEWFIIEEFDEGSGFWHTYFEGNEEYQKIKLYLKDL